MHGSSSKTILQTTLYTRKKREEKREKEMGKGKISVPEVNMEECERETGGIGSRKCSWVKGVVH